MSKFRAISRNTKIKNHNKCTVTSVFFLNGYIMLMTHSNKKERFYHIFAFKNSQMTPDLFITDVAT